MPALSGACPVPRSAGRAGGVPGAGNAAALPRGGAVRNRMRSQAVMRMFGKDRRKNLPRERCFHNHR